MQYSRLASLPQMQEKIDRIMEIFPKATATFTDDGGRAVITEDAGEYTYIIRVGIDYTTPNWECVVNGTAIRATNWLPVELDEALKLVSENA